MPIKTNSTSSIMEQLLATSAALPVTFSRGDQVKGKIISITSTEIILDLGAKSEGILDKRDLTLEQLADLKIGGSLKTYVLVAENESGQVILTMHRQSDKGGRKAQDQAQRFRRFLQVMNQQKQIRGQVTEVNKGGLVIGVDGVRGFLPSSQIGLSHLSNLSNLSDLVGKELPLTVLEVDSADNRLIFSARPKISDEVKEKLATLKSGQKVSGKIVALMPFGLFLDLDGVEGIVYSQEVSWGDGEDWNKGFEVGQEIEAKVLGKDEALGKVNLSIRHLTEDPFVKLTGDYQTDDVVKGTVLNITQTGIEVKLEMGVEGLIQPGKIEHGVTYEAGQTTNFLVESIDKNKRRVNLSPFITSTAGLIYR